MDISGFPKDYYVELRLGSSREWKSCRRLYLPLKFDLPNQNVLETLQIRVMQDLTMRLDPVISETEISVFELFVPNDEEAISRNIVFKSNQHQINLKDVRN